MSKTSQQKKELQRRKEERVEAGRTTPFDRVQPAQALHKPPPAFQPRDPRFTSWRPSEEGSTERYWENPRPGDIVQCRFPDFLRNTIANSQRKCRPALIVSVETSLDGTQTVGVAYGTSQVKDDRDSLGRPVLGHGVEVGELLVEVAKHRKCGLELDTKFSFRKIVKLPFNNEWFAPFSRQTHGVHPKRGHYDVSAPENKRVIATIIEEVRIHGSLLDGSGPNARLKPGMS